MGIPVTISDRGSPVRPVEANAPVMTVTGSGLPITISDKGAPFIVDGYEPDPEPEE